MKFYTQLLHGLVGKRSTSPFIPPVYGNVWTAITSPIASAIYGIVDGSDGFVYISTSNKIYKTSNLINFTECSLSGTLATRFGRIIEISNQRIACADDNGVWIKPALSDTFTRSTIAVNHNNYHIAGEGIDSSILYCSQTYLGVVYKFKMDMDQEVFSQATYEMGPTGASTWIHSPGIKLDDNTWIFTYAGTNYYRLVTINTTTNVVTQTLQFAGTGNIYNQIFKIGNTVYSILSNGSAIIMKTTTDGVTWSDDITVTMDAITRISEALAIGPTNSIIGLTDSILKSDDSSLNYATKKTLIGTPAVFCKMSNYKILAGTNGGSYLYISEE